MNEDVVRAVQNGIDWLNSHFPDWRSTIGTESRISSHRDCILCRLTRTTNFVSALREVRTQFPDETFSCWRHGFDVGYAGLMELEAEWDRRLKEETNR